MKNLLAGLLAASLVLALNFAPGCQQKSKEEAKSPAESKEMAGESVEQGKGMIQEAVSEGKEMVKEAAEKSKEMMEETAEKGKEVVQEAAGKGKEMMATAGNTQVAVKEAAAGKDEEMAMKASAESLEAGEALFKKHCAVCHPDGGNIINTKKTLSKEDLEANNIKTAKDIVKTMRNPGPGMNKFPEDKISDEDAMKIAEYILHVFQ